MIRGEHLTTLEMVTTTLDMLSVERPLLASGEVVVGIDEVGRGALAGPLTVGAVVLTCCDAPPDTLTDSKLLTAARREALVEPLERWAADWSLGSVSASEIDAWGLRLALAVAATRASKAQRAADARIDRRFFNLLRAPVDIGFGVAMPPELSYGRSAPRPSSREIKSARQLPRRRCSPRFTATPS